MEWMTALMTIIASIVYMFTFFIVKKAKKGEEVEFDKKKAVRTLIWGIIVGIFLAVRGVEPTMALTQKAFYELSAYAGLVALVEKVQVLILRYWERLPHT